MDKPQLQPSLQDAKALIAQGHFAQARAILLEITQTDAGSAEAWKALGVAENKLGNAESAERYLMRSLELNGADADAWSSLGGIYVATGRYAEALNAFEKSLIGAPPTTYALLNYLTMAAMVGDYDTAMRRYAAALAHGRRDCEAQIRDGANVPWCYYDLAQILFLENSPEFKVPLREALTRSVGWQTATARRTYELLAKSGRFVRSATEAIAEFAGHDATPPTDVSSAPS